VHLWRNLAVVALMLGVGCASGMATDDGGGGTGGTGGISGTGGTGGTGTGGSGGISGAGGTGGMSGSGGTGGMSGSGGSGGTGGVMIDAAPPDAAPPDAAAATCTPRAAVCDPVCNTGCGAGQRCDISGTANQGQCITTSGETQQSGQSCTATATTDSCVAQNACLADSKCYRLCYVDSDCGTNRCCNISIGLGTANTPSGFNACGASAGCDPTVTNAGSCGTGNACYFIPCATNTSNTDCASAGTGTTGTSCTYVNDCAPGYDCVGSTPQCHRTCRLASPNCPTNTTCTPIQIDTNTNSTVYGVCI
jgi:hypothetical protein